MRKNKMMRAASVLLVAVMLTTCAISGTFAKYTTKASGFDSARVAKWGVTVTANGTTFAKEYTTTDRSASTIINSVASSDKVLAPGTSGDMVSATISGTPEVAVKVTYSATLTLTNWNGAENVEYCPIVFTVNNVTYGTNDTAATIKSQNVSDLITAVQNAIADYSKTYKAGDDLSSKSGDALSVSWSWTFENNNDTKDTYLGNQAVNGTAAEISLTVITTVTQID